MIIDAENLFSDAQALTVGTTVSTNVIDLGTDRNIGIGEPMAVLVTVDAAAITGAGETYQIQVETDDAVGFGSPTVIADRSPAAADLTLGDRIVLPIPKDLSAERFLRLNYVLVGALAAVTFTAMLMPQSLIQAEAVYPDNITIS